MKALLDQMFSAGLSPELTSALKILAREIPNLHRDIQGGCGYARGVAIIILRHFLRLVWGETTQKHTLKFITIFGVDSLVGSVCSFFYTCTLFVASTQMVS